MKFLKIVAIPALALITLSAPRPWAYAETKSLPAPSTSLEVSNISVVKTEKIDFETRVEKDSALPAGVKLVVQEGKEGISTFYESSSESNGFVTKVFYDEVTVLPVEKVVRKGTNAEVIDGISDKTKKAEREKAEKKAKRLDVRVKDYDVPGGRYTTKSENRKYAKEVLNAEQFSCADRLVKRESGWNTRATNKSSGAYGVPQSLPGNKMASAGADWRTNGITQFKWMISYVSDRYGNFCNALDHSYKRGWY